MKVTIIEGPFFEERKAKAQEMIYSIIMKKVREQSEDQSRSMEKDVSDYVEDCYSDC